MCDYKNTALYTKVFRHMRPDYGIMWALLEVLKPRVLAEFGCGNGRLLPLWCASDAKEIIGLDVEAEMLREFAAVSDPRVRVELADLREPSTGMATADLTILTSSVLKHLQTDERRQALAALKQSLAREAYIYVDHCAHLYGVSESCAWHTYFDTLRNWWPEEHRYLLKRLSWRKDVEDVNDTLYYRDDESGNTASISTFVYGIDDLKSDIESVGLQHCTIATSFPAPMHLKGMQRLITLVSHPNLPLPQLQMMAENVRILAFETSI